MFALPYSSSIAHSSSRLLEGSEMIQRNSPAVRKEKKDLKRGDLIGDFYCNPCKQMFSHTSSLNRHRKETHNTEVQCLICNCHMQKGETVKDHLLAKHDMNCFTCSCCNWSFPDKKTFNAHARSMKDSNFTEPGDTQPIAMGANAPGAWAQKNNKRASSIGSSEGSYSSDGNVTPPIQSDLNVPSIVATPAPPAPKKRKLISSPPMKQIKEVQGDELSFNALVFKLIEEIALAHPLTDLDQEIEEAPMAKMSKLDELIYEMDKKKF